VSSRIWRIFASACTSADCACASAARSSLSSRAISTSPFFTVWPSSTGMRATRSVIVAPIATRCGVMMRPLATTVCTSGPRTAVTVRTGVPRIRLRPR
jgi:hypothetical protein